MDNLFKMFQQYLPTPVAWVLSVLCWPLANLAKALPQIFATVLQNRIEQRKLKMEEEKWELEKKALFLKAEKLGEKEVRSESETENITNKE